METRCKEGYRDGKGGLFGFGGAGRYFGRWDGNVGGDALGPRLLLYRVLGKWAIRSV